MSGGLSRVIMIQRSLVPSWCQRRGGVIFDKDPHLRVSSPDPGATVAYIGMFQDWSTESGTVVET